MNRAERITEEVARLARSEIEQEDFDAAVEAKKKQIRTHVPLWHRIFPWTITIKRRQKNGE